ncbi:MAG TPA: metallophosphoesterase [Steroidobacteraceae bacterium]|nr:metallophosphoesterase [Steroidobacteraceae bacterium]
MSDDARLLQISDPHLFADPNGRLRGVNTLTSLQRVLDHALAHRRGLDALLCTGDIVNDEPAGYAHFERLTGSIGLPVFCLPGNHDDARALRAALAHAPFQVGGHVDVGRWRLVLLDSSVPGRAAGHLAHAELERLRDALQGSDRHVMICLHHQPVPMASRWLDALGLDNAAELLALLDDYPKVRAITWGHVHQCFDSHRHGVRLLGTPSTGAQFLPLSREFAIDTRPPAYRLLNLRADGTLSTELVWVEPASSLGEPLAASA